MIGVLGESSLECKIYTAQDSLDGLIRQKWKWRGLNDIHFPAVSPRAVPCCLLSEPDMRLGYWPTFSVGCILKFGSIDPKQLLHVIMSSASSSAGFTALQSSKNLSGPCSGSGRMIVSRSNSDWSDQIPIVLCFWRLAGRLDGPLGWFALHIFAPLRHRKPSIDSQLLQGAFGFHADRWAT